VIDGGTTSDCTGSLIQLVCSTLITINDGYRVVSCHTQLVEEDRRVDCLSKWQLDVVLMNANTDLPVTPQKELLNLCRWERKVTAFRPERPIAVIVYRLIEVIEQCGFLRPVEKNTDSHHETLPVCGVKPDDRGRESSSTMKSCIRA
jgi:hypothetical protein